MRIRLIIKIVLYGIAFSFLNFAAPLPANNHLEGKSFPLGEKVLATARAMMGKPYKYRGETPAGFDCSGLVRYSYLATGVDVPRATSGLKEATNRIEYCEMRKGDLVFFDRNGKKYGHVGIYAGDDRFIHAPSLGKYVRIDSLRNPYWKGCFTEARRFEENALQRYTVKNKDS